MEPPKWSVWGGTKCDGHYRHACQEEDILADAPTPGCIENAEEALRDWLIWYESLSWRQRVFGV